MQKDIFYRCMKEDDSERVYALKTTGFSDGDIGLHKAGDFWFATHIPTGCNITPTLSHNKTCPGALNEAKRIIAEKPDYDAHIQKVMGGEAYKVFAQSKYAQVCFTVL